MKYLASDSGAIFLCLPATKCEFYIFSKVEANYTKPHLIFTNVGDAANPPYACFSFVGRIGNAGQIINLGRPQCLAIGMILHETLHGLG